MKQAIEIVMNALKGVTGLRWVDVNLGQMNTEAPPVDYPCALVDVASVDYSTGTRGQTGDITVEVELYFICRTPSNMAAPVEMRAQSMAHFDVIDRVNEVLHGLQITNGTRLVRSRLTRDKNYYPRAFRLSYTCRKSY